MKTKAILATLLVVAAASADARFAWPYPPKAISPDEIGYWVVISGNAWPNSPLVHRFPTPFVVNETWTDDSKLLNDQRFEALVPQLALSRSINSKQEPVSRI